MLTLIDLPLDVIGEIALIVDAADTIALRQVHRSFSGLPIKLDDTLPGLLDSNIFMRYPNIYSFTGFNAYPKGSPSLLMGAMGMKWFFDLHLTHPGYNNIRRLEITREKDIGPLPLALEELSIIKRTDRTYSETRFYLSHMKRLRVVKCEDERVIFINLPDTIVDLEIDIMNLEEFGKLPKALARLKITNHSDTDLDLEDINFSALHELRELVVFGALREDELPPKLMKFSCASFESATTNIVAAMGAIYSISMQRPNHSIPWDPLAHIIEFTGESSINGDLTEFVNLQCLDIHTIDGMKYCLPPNITDLTVRNSGVPLMGKNSSAPDFIVGLDNLKRLHLQYIDMLTFGTDIIPTMITHLNLENVNFSRGSMHLNFSNIWGLMDLHIRANQPIDDGGIWTSCTIADNQKLETITLYRINIIGRLPPSLTELYIRDCELDHALVGLDLLKRATIIRSRLVDTTIPVGLKTLHLANNHHRESDDYRLYSLRSLETLVIKDVYLAGPLPSGIIDLSIHNYNQSIDISHLSRLLSLSIESANHRFITRTPTPLYIKTKIIGPLPPSLRCLDLRSSTQCFDLTDLPNLECLNIIGWNNNVEGMGTFPISIKILDTDIDFDIKKCFLPNLVEHRKTASFWMNIETRDMIDSDYDDDEDDDVEDYGEDEDD